MSYLVNKIIQSMVFINGKKYNRRFTAARYINKIRSVEVEGIVLKVKLSLNDFAMIKKKIDEKELQDFIEPD
jgi:hypothetical protein